jgi:hypothetical protein
VAASSRALRGFHDASLRRGALKLGNQTVAHGGPDAETFSNIHCAVWRFGNIVIAAFARRTAITWQRCVPDAQARGW